MTQPRQNSSAAGETSAVGRRRSLLLRRLLLPVRLVALLVLLLRSALLFVAALVACAYFYFTVQFSGVDVLNIVNGELAGQFQAKSVYVSPLSDQVLGEEVNLYHPDGRELIHVQHLDVDFSRQDILGWALRFLPATILGDEPDRVLPIHLTRIRLDGYRVTLPFEEQGFAFLEAFQPKVITPPSGKPGLQPDVALERIDLGEGEVHLVFPFFRMDIGVASLQGDVFVRDAQPEVSARNVNVASYQLLGLIPEPASFVGEETSAVSVREFLLKGTTIAFSGLDVRHPDFKVQGKMAFDFVEKGLPVEASGSFQVENPRRVEHLTMGHVTGTASGTFHMFGHLEQPQFEFGFSSPWLAAEEIEIEDARGTTTLSVIPEVRIGVPELTARVWGSEVKATDFELTVAGDQVSMGFNGCAEGLYLSSLAQQFDIDALWAFDDVPVSACLTDGRLELPNGEVKLTGRASADVRGGSLPVALGLWGATVEGLLEVTLQSVALRDARIHSNLASLGGDFSLGFGQSQPVFSLSLSGQAADLSALPFANQLKLAGAVRLDSLLFDGTLDDPHVEVELAAQRLRLLGSWIENLEIKGSLKEGRAALDRVCFDQAGNKGCLGAHAELGKNLTQLPEKFPVSLVVLNPLTLDLSALPFVTLPVQGLVTAGPVDLSAEISPDLEAIVASVRGNAELQVNEGRWGDYAFQEARLRVEKGIPGQHAGMLGGLSARLALKGVAVPEGGVGEASLNLEVRRFLLGQGIAGVKDASAAVGLTLTDGRLGEIGLQHGEVQFDLADLRSDSWNSLIPGALASGTARLDGLSQGDQMQRLLELRFDGSNPAGSVDLTGSIALNDRLKAHFTSQVDRLTNLANLKAEATNLPIGSLPALRRRALVRNLLLDTRVTANLDVKDIDLQAAVEGDIWRVVQRLSGRGKLLVKNLQRLPEPVEQLSASFKASHGKITVEPLDVTLTGNRHVWVRGDYTPRVKEAHLTVKLDPIRLSTVKLLAALALPLDVVVGGEVSLNGRLPVAALEGHLHVQDMTAVGLSLGDASLDVVGTLGEDLWFTSPEFFKGFTLHSGVLAFRDHKPSHLSLGLGFEKFSLQRVLPSLPSMVDVQADGTGTIDVRFAPNEEPFTLALLFPPKTAKACASVPPLSLCLANEAESKVVVTSQGISTPGLTLSGEGQSVGMKGQIGFQTGFALDLQANLDLAWFRPLSQVFATYSGRVATAGAGMRLAGMLDTPTIRGFLEMKDVQLLPRGLGEEILIPSARLAISGDLKNGNLTVAVGEATPLKGSMDEGEFQVFGNLAVQNWMPTKAQVTASGQDLFIQIPGQLRLQFSTKLNLQLEDLQDPDITWGKVSGDVYIAEGDFTKSFDRLLGSFSYALARKQERYSKPITEILPFLKRTELALSVRGGNFNVASRFPFGEAELTVELDMRVGGTLENLKLYDRMRVVPGGSLTYKVVKRVFQVQQGSVDFYGDPTAPYLDVKARTEVLYTPPADYVSTWTQEERAWGRAVGIEVHITGTYPNITFELTSDSPEFDVADLQTLLLLGMTRRDLEGRSATGSSDVSINLLTDDVAGMVSKLILGPFIDAMSLGFTQEGGIRAETATRLGRAMNLSTKVRQDSSRSEYSAGFQFRITDWLSLEGKLKMIQEQSESLRNYEAKFRYSIPLE